MNRVMSFLLGAICMLVAVLAVNMLIEKEQPVADVSSESVSKSTSKPLSIKHQVDHQIAYVNNDLGIAGTDINIASSLIDNMVANDDYEVSTTTYNDAVSGLENDQYVAYIVFGADYSTSLASITTDQLPTKAKIDVRINPNLSDEQQSEVAVVLLNQYNYIHSTISYLYLTYLLDAVHNSQNNVDTVIENEDYMNSVAGSVAEYSTNTISNFKEYLSAPDKTEIELDTSGLEAISDQQIEAVTPAEDIDVEPVKQAVVDDQSALMTSVSNALVNDEMETSSLDLELPEVTAANSEQFENSLNELLVANTASYQNIADRVNEIKNQVPAPTDVNTDFRLPNADDLAILHVMETMVKYTLYQGPDLTTIESMADDSRYANIYYTINTFILDYANWYNNSMGITPEVCTGSSCFDDFDSLPLADWRTEYQNLRTTYQNIVIEINDVIDSLPATVGQVRHQLSRFASSIVKPQDHNYVTDITADDQTPSTNYQRVEQYCSNNSAPTSAVGKLGCEIFSVETDYIDYKQAIADYNTELGSSQQAIDDFNKDNEEAVSAQNEAVANANSEVTDQLNAKNTSIIDGIESGGAAVNSKLDDFTTAINDKISTLNESKGNFATSTVDMLKDYQRQLNNSISTVEDSLYNDRKDASDAAQKYNDEYGDTSSYYDSNIETLNQFTSILPNTRNGAEANFYLYDYLVNPLKVAVQLGEKGQETANKIIESETDSDSGSQEQQSTDEQRFDKKIIILMIVLALGLLFIILRIGEDDYE